MCGRYNVHDLSAALLWLFGMSEGPAQPPRYNIAPTQQVAAVRHSVSHGGKEAALLRWGLVPFWAKDIAIGAKLINARAETVAEKPSFRAAYRQRRCLIPATGYYEWRKEEEGKQPYHIYFRDHEPFAMAGLWEHWQPRDGQAVESCTILTTEANSTAGTVHHRMPVILAPEHFDLWLDPKVAGGEQLAGLLKPYPAPEQMAVDKVSTLVNSARNDNPLCIRPT